MPGFKLFGNRKNSFARLRRHSAALLAVCSLACPLAGCGGTQTAPKALSEDGSVSEVFSDEALALDYAVPVMTPAIKVDQVGYTSKGIKRAFLSGTHIPDSFRVIDMETGEAVYEGSVTNRTGEMATLDFTAFEEAGSYCLEADVVGVSYAFTIGDEVYADALESVLKQFYLNRCGISLTEQYAGEGAHSVCHTTAASVQDGGAKTVDVTGGWHLDARMNRSVPDGCTALDHLLLAYEMNPEAFTDETGIPESGNEIPDILDEAAYEAAWLLKMQEASTGGVYEAALTEGAEDGNPMLMNVVVSPVTMEATGSFAAALARFASLFRTYDEELATQCVQASDKAFRLCRAAKEGAVGKSYRAACELYRATGDARYKDAIDEYLKDASLIENIAVDADCFYAAVAYLSTSGEVDRNACARMMDVLMDGARTIAEEASASSYRVAAEDADAAVADGETGADETVARASAVLDEMRLLAVVNHILYNYEYQTMIEDHAHYLMGRNERAVNYVTDASEYSYAQAGASGLKTQPLQAAQLVFLLSGLNSSGSS